MLSGPVARNHPTTAGLFGLFARPAHDSDAGPVQEQAATGPTDTVEISGRSRQLLAGQAQNPPAPDPAAQPAQAPVETAAEGATAETAEAPAANPQELSEEEQNEVKELKDRDREVRAHEQAHLAAAGGYARGGPTYEYQRGPDGRRYAVGGHVDIDTSPVPNDPDATIRKAQVIRSAANAPAEPSAQDRSVAAEASRMESEARRQLSEQRRAESADQTDGPQDARAVGTATGSVPATPPSSEAGPPPATSPTAPGRFGRSEGNVGQVLQLFA